jgi:acetate kinase
MSVLPVLAVNTGSSSLKMGLYEVEDEKVTLLLDGEVEGIGQARGKLRITGPAGETLHHIELASPMQRSAFRQLAEEMKILGLTSPHAIGHRVAHGGPHLLRYQRVTDDILETLTQSVHFAPLHIPDAVELIQESRLIFPGLPHFACFDTAFHSSLPERVTRFALSGQYFDEGVRKYGFHGLSYESVLCQLDGDVPSRIVIAHLGSGASLAAVSHGKSMDTSMGLTPTGGIPMATRTGDIDPGVLLYLMRAHGMDADSLEALLNRESGWKALSGGMAQMEAIQAAASAGDVQANWR